MKNKLSLFVAFLSLLTFSFCSSSKKTTTTTSSEPVAKPSFTYEKDVASIMMASCAPCHFPETGKKKQLDTYQAIANNIDDILVRVQLPIEHDGYMPFKSKKPALTEAEISLLKKWKSENMPK